MKRIFVSSSNITSVGYDAETQVLEVEFVSGGVYQYFDVPYNLYGQLMNSSSKGKFLNTHIKNNYQYQKENEIA